MAKTIKIRAILELDTKRAQQQINKMGAGPATGAPGGAAGAAAAAGAAGRGVATGAAAGAAAGALSAGRRGRGRGGTGTVREVLQQFRNERAGSGMGAGPGERIMEEELMAEEAAGRRPGETTRRIQRTRGGGRRVTTGETIQIPVTQEDEDRMKGRQRQKRRGKGKSEAGFIDKDVVKKIFSGIGKGLTGALKGFGKVIKGVGKGAMFAGKAFGVAAASLFGLKLLGDQLAQFSGPIAVAMGELESIFMTLFESIAFALEPLFSALGEILAPVVEGFQVLMTGLRPLIAVLVEILTPIFEAIGAILKAMAPILKLIALILKPFVFIFKILGEVIKWVTGLFGRLATAIQVLMWIWFGFPEDDGKAPDARIDFGAIIAARGAEMRDPALPPAGLLPGPQLPIPGARQVLPGVVPTVTNEVFFDVQQRIQLDDFVDQMITRASESLRDITQKAVDETGLLINMVNAQAEVMLI